MPIGRTRERMYRVERVRRRAARGATAKEIADALEVKVSQVQADLRLIDQEADGLLKQSTAKHAAMIWQRYEELFRTAWEAFAASQGDVVITTIKSDEMEEIEEGGTKRQVPKNPKHSLVRKKSAGDPRFHHQAMEAVDRMAEMVGLATKRGMPGQDTAPAVGGAGIVVHIPVNGRDVHLQQGKEE